MKICYHTVAIAKTRSEKWKQRTDNLRTMARETFRAEEKTRKAAYKVILMHRWMNSTRALEQSEKIRLRDEIRSTSREAQAERTALVSRKLEFAEALCRWRDELEAEMEECKVENVSQEYAKTAQASLRGIEELLDIGWLPDIGKIQEVR
jgi:hypothetical protein